MNILKDIEDLVKSEVISEEVAIKIQDYYKNKSLNKSNRLFVVFGVLGALLIGLGIILILAHNWDNFSKITKTILAFLPLVTAQIAGFYTLFKKNDSAAWRESSATLIFFTVGSSISLISQIYNIPGNLNSFVLTWMILILPLVYIFRSSMLSLLYIAGITFYACSTNYWSYPSEQNYYYWLLLVLIIPFYYFIYKKKPESNFTYFNHWFIPLSITICLGIVARSQEEIMFLAYFSLFAIFYAIGNSKLFKDVKNFKNSYLVIGSFATVVLLISMSFDWFWMDLYRLEFIFLSNEFIVASLLFILASIIL